MHPSAPCAVGVARGQRSAGCVKRLSGLALLCTSIRECQEHPAAVIYLAVPTKIACLQGTSTIRLYNGVED